ncbi:antibiotic biosynthesis monooxygenase family protein [Nocardioides sp.]|uniref:putative quinol monooxygenase n=1 Tax=Nocardioides sp. TaxID=35761 RepID=UPI001A2C9DA7|nr:antibiotic biosynthesis monooxygenase family protein [Nocardioides sp.]MBJ7358221.1 antibiotic biosynthesis monooxygenase [Nocardioides sp.]
MVIVAGHLLVDAAERDAYLRGCVAVVDAARGADGCLDFAISADLVDAGRVNILERWVSQEAVEAFRGAGVPDEQGAAIRELSVSEYDIAATRELS